LSKEDAYTRWADDYNLDRALSKLALGDIPLPAWDAPDVFWASNAPRDDALTTPVDG
jgi:hypothetical protein